MLASYYQSLLHPLRGIRRGLSSGPTKDPGNHQLPTLPLLQQSLVSSQGKGIPGR